MSNLYVSVTNELIAEAIKDLALKGADLVEGSQNATRHFERLIGSDGHPDITLEDKIALLQSVQAELEHLITAMNSDTQPDGPLSGEAILVLADYSDSEPRQGLSVPLTRFGQGIPCGELNWAATAARARLALVLAAIAEDLDPPEITFASYFEAYCDEIGDEAFDEEDDLFFVSASIDYLSELIDESEMAWKEGIEIPQILLDHVLAPFLAQARTKVCLH